MKVCPKCKLNRRPTSYYYRQNGERISHCKDCIKQKAAWWAKDHPTSKAKNTEVCLRVRYGITVERYGEMFFAQQGKCAICLRHQTQLSYKLNVDHDHKTGKVRGLLCGRCNSSLSVLENKEWIKLAEKYLGDHYALAL